MELQHHIDTAYQLNGDFVSFAKRQVRYGKNILKETGLIKKTSPDAGPLGPTNGSGATPQEFLEKYGLWIAAGLAAVLILRKT